MIPNVSPVTLFAVEPTAASVLASVRPLSLEIGSRILITLASVPIDIFIS